MRERERVWRERERERERMNDSFWSQMDAVVAETLNDHKFMDKIEPPRTVKKIMNVVKRTYVRFTTKVSKSKQRTFFCFHIRYLMMRRI